MLKEDLIWQSNMTNNLNLMQSSTIKIIKISEYVDVQKILASATVHIQSGRKTSDKQVINLCVVLVIMHLMSSRKLPVSDVNYVMPKMHWMW